MKKYINIKNLYLLTFISFILIVLFLYYFVKTAPYFYTGFDNNTVPNLSSSIANFIFKFLILFHFTCVILSVTYSLYKLFNRVGGK